MNYNNNNNNNISRLHLFRAYIVYAFKLLTAPIRAVLRYGRIYRNYSTVLLHILKNEYPIKAILRSGNHIVLHNNYELFFVTRIECTGWTKYEIIGNKVTISSFDSKTTNRTKIELWDGAVNGDPLAVFLDRVYKFLPVDGKIVIDIGANIGESCIYFALSGAKKVIGLEPFPKSYEMAKRNIEQNGLTDKIALNLAGCAAEGRDITIDPSHNSKSHSYLIEFREGIRIPLLSIRDILTKNKISAGEAVLKMDCEGCEYDTILSSSKETIRFFSHIQLEYHCGYKNLKEKIEKCGFKVSISIPYLEQSTAIPGNRMLMIGYLYATRL